MCINIGKLYSHESQKLELRTFFDKIFAVFLLHEGVDVHLLTLNSFELFFVVFPKRDEMRRRNFVLFEKLCVCVHVCEEIEFNKVNVLFKFSTLLQAKHTKKGSPKVVFFP